MPSVQPQSRAAPGSIGSATPVLDRSGQANEEGLRLERESIGQSSAPFFQRVPRALDLPDPGRLFTTEQLGKKLKVLFIVSQPTGSPAISVHANLMRFFDRDRVEVHVLYNRRADGEPFQTDGTSARLVLPSSEDIQLRAAEFGPVRGAPSRALLTLDRPFCRGLRFVTLLGLLRYIRRNGIDVIHCEKGPRNGLYGLLLSRLTRARYVAHFHWKYGNWMSRISRFAVRRADAIIAVSSWTGRPIHVAGVPRERIIPVLNGIDVSAWDPATVDGDSRATRVRRGARGHRGRDGRSTRGVEAAGDAGRSVQAGRREAAADAVADRREGTGSADGGRRGQLHGTAPPARCGVGARGAGRADGPAE